MFSDLINKIKAKIPKRGGSAESPADKTADIEINAEASVTQDLAAPAEAANPEAAPVDGAAVDGATAADGKKPEDKKKVKPIKLIICLGIFYLVYDMVMSEDPPPETTKKAATDKSKEPKAQAKDGTAAPAANLGATAQAPTEAQPEPAPAVGDVQAPAPVTENIPEPAPAIEPAPAVDNSQASAPAAKPALDIPSSFEAVPEAAPVTESIPGPAPAVDTGQASAPAVESVPVMDAPALDPVAAPPVTESAIESSPQVAAIPPTTSADIMGQSDPAPAPAVPAGPSIDEQLEDIILKVENEIPKNELHTRIDYVAPPDYEGLGRGLVYNCLGKHWACVGQRSYTTCKKNKIWAIQNRKFPECNNVEVYATSNDCQVVQTHKINSATDVPLCGVRKTP